LGDGTVGGTGLSIFTQKIGAFLPTPNLSAAVAVMDDKTRRLISKKNEWSTNIGSTGRTQDAVSADLGLVKHIVKHIQAGGDW
jgi:hypothetical protein